MHHSSRSIVWTLLVLEIVVGTLLVRRPQLVESTAITSKPDKPVETEPESSAFRQQLIGTWRDNYRAQRTLTLREDGTGTMHCVLQGMHRLFASELTFQEAWELDGDQLTMRVTGGVPEDKVAFVLRLKGDVTHQKILSVTENELHVYDAGEKVEFHWQRVTSDRDLADVTTTNQSLATTVNSGE